jgi:hypothetical protein
MKTREDFIGKHVKRTSRNLLLTNLVIIVGIIWLWLANAFYGAGLWGLAIFGLFALGCWNIVKFWKRKKKPSSHPIITALSRIGPPQEIAALINEEVKKSKLFIKPIIITESWLLRPSIYGLEMLLLGELVWVHKKVTQHYTYFIPTNKSFEVAIYKRDGKSIEVSCSEQDSDSLIQGVMKSAPWVVAGFSEEIQKFWDTDRPGFIAYVDQRKRGRNAG